MSAAAARTALTRAVLRAVVLPLLLVTVALLGGLRVGVRGELAFVPPPAIALLLGALLMGLFARAGLVGGSLVFRAEEGLLTLTSNALTVLALFAASVQAVHSVLPERGPLHWILSAFLLWTLWTDQFASEAPARVLRRLAAMFVAAFVVKHVLLASLFAPEPGLARRLAAAVFEGLSLTTTDAPAWGPATAYVSFGTLALMAVALTLVTPARSGAAAVLEGYEALPAPEQDVVRRALTVSVVPDRERLGPGDGS